MNADRPTEAYLMWEWYDCSAPDVVWEMHETAHKQVPWVWSSKKHGSSYFSDFSAREESLLHLVCKRTASMVSLD